MVNSCWLSRAGGGGESGSLTPRFLATCKLVSVTVVALIFTVVDRHTVEHASETPPPPTTTGVQTHAFPQCELCFPLCAASEMDGVAMALFAACHHSFNRKEYTLKVAADELNYCPRAQKMDKARGVRPGVLKEPEPQGVASRARADWDRLAKELPEPGRAPELGGDLGQQRGDAELIEMLLVSTVLALRSPAQLVDVPLQAQDPRRRCSRSERNKGRRNVSNEHSSSWTPAACEAEELVAEEEACNGGSSALVVMPRRIFGSIMKNCADTLRSPYSSSAKAEARSRLGQLLDWERRGGVG